MIKDSGSRTEFESGAVRDIQEGKGRCDLLPLDMVNEFLGGVSVLNPLLRIHHFQCTGDWMHLLTALSDFGSDCGWDRNTVILEVSKQFEDGAVKYGENNWQKGIPVRCYINSAVRHYLKWLRGDNDEPHDRAFCWNLICAAWTCKNKPELNSYGKEDER